MNEQEPRGARYIPVEDWDQANAAIKEVVAGQEYSLDSSHEYPHPFAVLYKDALSGAGMGYYIYKTKDRRLGEYFADIEVLGKRREAPLQE